MIAHGKVRHTSHATQTLDELLKMSNGLFLGRRSLSTDINWIHPSQIRISLLVSSSRASLQCSFFVKEIKYITLIIRKTDIPINMRHETPKVILGFIQFQSRKLFSEIN